MAIFTDVFASLRGNFLRHVSSFLAGSSAAYLLAILAMPLVTRLYPPAVFGIFSLFLVTLAILGAAINLRWDMAIASANSERAAALLAIGAIGSAPLCAMLATLVLIAGRAMGWFGLDTLPSWSPAAAFVAITFQQISSAVHYSGVRRHDFSFLGRQQVYTMALRLGLQLAAGIAGLQAFGLVLGEVLGRLCTACYGVYYYGRDWLREWRAKDASDIRNAAVAARKFTIVLGPSTFIDACANQLPVLLIATNFGVKYAGLYVLAERVVFAPVNTMGRAVAEVFHGHLSTLVREQSPKAWRLALQMAGAMLLLGLVPWLVFFGFGPVMFEVAFGPDWRPAGEIAAIVSIMAYAGLIAYPLGRALQVLGRQELKLVFDLGSMAVTVLALGLGGPFLGATLMVALTWFAVGMAVMYLLACAMVTLAFQKPGKR